MKNTVILFAILLSFPLINFSQETSSGLSIEFSNIDFFLPKSKNMAVLKIIKENNKYVLLRKEPIKGPGGWSYFVERFNENLEREKTINISDLIGGEVEDFIKVKNSFFIINTQKDKKNNTKITYAYPVSIPSLKVGEKIAVYSGEYIEDSYVSFKTSPNEEHLVVVNYFACKKEEKRKLQYNVYSSDLYLEYESKEIRLREQCKEFSIDETIITNNSEVLLFGTVEKEKKYFKIYRLTDGEEDSFSFEEKIEGITVSMADIFQDKEGNLIGGGYYVAKKKGGHKGMALFRFNVEEMDISEFNVHEFSFEIDNYHNFEGNSLESMRLIDVIFLDNGDYYTIGEETIYKSFSTQDAYTGKNNHSVYYYRSIVVSMFSEEELVWENMYSRSLSKGLCYQYILHDDIINLIYKPYSGMGKIISIAIYEESINSDGTLFTYEDPIYQKFRGNDMVKDLFVVDDHKEVIALTYFGSRKINQFKLARILVE